MNTVRRIASLFRDSPNFGRDRANLVSGFTIGTAGLLLNFAVMGFVMPLFVEPDNFREITEHLEFGQLLALILLGGATLFATLLIPLRLISVFWGPRLAGYFDQVVLSGISPLRFVIGKATSQNLFLGLILFLLLPYFALSLTLGGVKLQFFVAGLFLVWLYCMMLALVTLWASLYFNELLSAVIVIGLAAIAGGFGSSPLRIQPFVVTPFPALTFPFYDAIPYFERRVASDFWPIFLECVAGMGVICCVAMLFLYLGPLYGIVKENSTFGEVVQRGDSKRKRWFRLRLHIQRPSEIAFFYQNRGDTFRSSEGSIRWGVGMGGMLLLFVAAYTPLLYTMQDAVNGIGSWSWWAATFHAMSLTIHGMGLVFAVFLFSHTKNTVHVKLGVTRGLRCEVGSLDTMAFLFWLVLSTISVPAIAFVFERFIALPAGQSLFPNDLMNRGRAIDLQRLCVEGSIVLAISSLVIYAWYRYGCLLTWVRVGPFLVMMGLYFAIICLMPFIAGVMVSEVQELRQSELLARLTPIVAMVSPITVISCIVDGAPQHFPRDASTLPFYVVHAVLLVLAIRAIRAYDKKLRFFYASSGSEEVVS